MSSAAVPVGSASSYATPPKRAAFVNAEAGPSRARPPGGSPAYSSRRHSLYGIEDRIVIEPGSRYWKVGFSGEVDPRAIFSATDDGEGLEGWDLDLDRLESARGDRAEARRLIGVRVLRQLRATYIRHLMTDPKARKVIVIENTYLPSSVKDEIAKSLFEDLKVPSVSFTPASVLALAACGRITGLVVKCGWLETTITPVYHSRPLFHLSRATPLAGRRLHQRVKALLIRHARYYPPPVSFSTLTRQAVPAVPSEVITDDLVQRIIRQGCFVSDAIAEPFSLVGQAPSSACPDADDPDNSDFLYQLKERYISQIDATDLRISLRARSSETQGMGPSTLVVPGWVRERAAEVMFGDEEGEAERVPDLFLNCILKLPVDLRATMISSVLIVGGTASLPGFIPRLRASLLQTLRPNLTSSSLEPHPAPLHTPEYRMAETKSWRRRHAEPYKELYQLGARLAILNDPCPVDGEAGTMRGGSAPRWRSGLMSWVGGSLAGALKTGAPEMLREEYDALAHAHTEKGDTYRHRLAEEADFVSQLLSETTAAAAEPVPTVSEPAGSASLQVQAPRLVQHEVGIQIEDLLPGMAIGGTVRRKRGWNGEMSIGDWTKVIRA